ncbi:hypothetical protein CTI12_AA195320 [Artemisia annua]|uniref:DUF4283 domain-containing protein n=1 Tax=Artemisia annua TaxID=35608 RepID=A0A2U1P3N1_ARTAN|nr:hypothetical protein CTI12_AA195320 [Artemisia annua]
MSNRNRSNRQTKALVWLNDHVVGTSSQIRKEKVDVSTGKENSVQSKVTGMKGGDKKNGVQNKVDKVNEVEVNTNGPVSKEGMNAEINNSVSKSVNNTIVIDSNEGNNEDIDTPVNEIDANKPGNSNNKDIIGTSYANVVKKDEFPKELLYILTEMNEAGNEVVVFDEMLVKNGSERWRLTACGQFIGFNMHISELRYNIRRMWSKFGVTDISASKNGQYLFMFRDIDGLNSVIDQGPWMVQNKPLFIHRWSPDMGIELTKLLRTHKYTPFLDPTKIRLAEVRYELLSRVIILKENVLSLKGVRKQLPACCAHMLYCLLTQQPYNLAYFFAKRIVHLKGNKDKLIPYRMFLTRLYHYLMNFHPYLRGPHYSLFPPAMEPLNESHVSSIFISAASVDFDIYDDPTDEGVVRTQLESVMEPNEVEMILEKQGLE